MTSYTGLQVAQIYCVQHEDKNIATVRLKRGNGMDLLNSAVQYCMILTNSGL